MRELCPVCGEGHELAVRDGRLRLIGCRKVPKDLVMRWSLSEHSTVRRDHAVPAIDQRPWQTCPVCFGKGIVAQGFYSTPGTTTQFSTNTMPDKCRSCGGRGIVR